MPSNQITPLLRPSSKEATDLEVGAVVNSASIMVDEISDEKAQTCYDWTTGDPILLNRLSGLLKEAHKAPKGDPREAKMTPRSAPGAPREGPKRRQDSARSGQERPRSAPRAAQEANKRSKKGSSYRFRSWGGPGRPPGAILKRSGSDFGASGVAFWSHFQEFFLCLQRSVEPARARGVPSDTPAQNAERGRGARPRSLTRMLS